MKENILSRRKLIEYYMKNCFKQEFTLILFLSVLVSLVSIPIPFLYKRIINQITAISFNEILYLVLIYILLLIIKTTLAFISRRKTSSMQYDVAFTVGTDIYRHIFGLPYSYLVTRDKGDLMKLVSFDSNNLFYLITYGILQILSLSFQLVIDLIIVVSLFGAGSLIVLFLAPVCFYFIRKGTKIVETYGRNYEEARKNFFSYTYSPLTKIKEIKSRRLETFLSAKMEEANNELKIHGRKYGYANTSLYYSYDFFDQGIYALFFLIGCYQVSIGSMSLGTFFAVLYVFNSIVTGLSSLSFAVIDNYLKNIPSLDRLVELYSIPVKYGDKYPPVNTELEVKFDKVEFSYPGSDFSLKIGSLALCTGKKYCLIGKTGSGKSTLFDLITGIQFPTSGNITLNGINTNEVAETWWQQNVVILLQDSSIFKGSIKENIILDDIDKSLDIKAFVKSLGLAGFFNRFQKGLSTEANEGYSLSGGEKQMIGAIRLLLKKDCQIALIDEGKKGLDKALATQIDDLFYTSLDNKLSITITHDLSEISRFDEIIYIHAGKVHCGTHIELLKNEDYKNYLKR
ncbi:MAG: ABC transporter ATP-binding protein/permease [Candidatus Cloacimonetes bacterium]|nr:ABC transporter ATP-binding protein/permease [Candidatus Cloacimonadota bacterium]